MTEQLLANPLFTSMLVVIGAFLGVMFLFLVAVLIVVVRKVASFCINKIERWFL